MHRKPSKKWWGAYRGLYGEQIDLGVGEGLGEKRSLRGGQKKAVKIDCPSEQEEQFALVAWLTKKNIICHHSPNGGHRDAREGAKFKRLGVSPGFPDLFLPYPRSSKFGLFLELKRVKGGSLSDHQKWWRDFLLAQGYAWFEAKGADEAIAIVSNYLGLT